MESVFVLSDVVTFFRVLNAREAALASRKNCVKNWMAWHTKLKAEEDHVTQMEQAALKLITAASSAFLHQGNFIVDFFSVITLYIYIYKYVCIYI